MSTQIPSITATVTSNHVHQYFAQSTATKVNITRAFMLSSIIMNTSGSTTNYRVTNAVKINSITVWSISATLGTPSPPIAIEWLSSYGPSKIVSDTTLSTAFPAMIHSRPPANSLAGYWSLRGSNESDVLFLVTCATGSIIHVNMTYNLQDDTAVTSVSTTNSGSAGTLYYTSLDGPAAGSVLLQNVLPTLN
jgi:hypothetical protein